MPKPRKQKLVYGSGDVVDIMCCLCRTDKVIHKDTTELTGNLIMLVCDSCYWRVYDVAVHSDEPVIGELVQYRLLKCLHTGEDEYDLHMRIGRWKLGERDIEPLEEERR